MRWQEEELRNQAILSDLETSIEALTLANSELSARERVMSELAELQSMHIGIMSLDQVVCYAGVMRLLNCICNYVFCVCVARQWSLPVRQHACNVQCCRFSECECMNAVHMM